MGCGQVRVNGESFARLDDGLVQLALSGQDDAEVAMRRGQLRVDGESFAGLNDGLVQLALIEQGVAEADVGARTLGAEGYGDAEIMNRILYAARLHTVIDRTQLQIDPEVARVLLLGPAQDGRCALT